MRWFHQRPVDLDGSVPSAELAPREELEGLDFVVAREAEREVREGRMHTGLGSVVQVVGIRH